jgi:hypothetical protein
LEDLLASGLSLSFLGLNLSLTALLLLSVAAEHLILIHFHFFLLTNELTLLVHRLDHVEFRLLLLHLNQGDHLLILLNHLLDDLINLILFLKVLLVGFLSKLSFCLHLALQVVFLLQSEAFTLLLFLSLNQIFELLFPKHVALHLCVCFLQASITVKYTHH